jgi:two-component system chemotaxis response regulator CheB
VLSGALDDGTAGLAAIKARGGITIVQNPQESLYSSMPQSALDNVAVDHVVSQSELAALLEQLIADPLSHGAAAQGPAMAIEVAVAEHGALGDLPEHTSLGEPSGFACPDCHGVLWEIKEDELIRFRCRVGHAYLPASLAAAQSGKLEEALWTAMRALRESAALATRLATRATERNMLLAAQAHEKRAGEAHERARVIEEVLARGQLAMGERQSP